MAWVRYDDRFSNHEKVLAVRAKDPGALALHLLANTWTSSTKTPGWIPAHAPSQLVGTKGKKWAALLVAVNLWEVGTLGDETGWWVHDFDTYNPVDEATKAKRSESARRAANARWDAKRMRDALQDAGRTQCDEQCVTDADSCLTRGHPDPQPQPEKALGLLPSQNQRDLTREGSIGLAR